MMNKKMAVIVSLIISINMLSGCAETPETPVVRSKGEDAMERYKEAENLNVPSEKSEMDSGADEVIKTDTTVSENLLQTRLDIPAHYKNEVSDTTGKLNVFTDADLIIPEVETVPAIYVKRHESDQDDIDAITRALFGTVDVYDAHSYMVKTKDEWLAVIEKLKGYEAIGNLDPQGLGTDANGNYVYDLHGEIEEAQRAYETAPEKRELSKLTTPYEFKEELIDPWMPEIGSVRKVYGFVKAADGNSYQYNLTKENNESLGIWAKKIESEGELAERASYLWSEYDSMKMLYSWVPDESAINLGVTKEEAQKMADEKVAALNLQDMQIASSGIVLELRLGYSGKPQEKDMTDIGYVFHYTRQPAGIPVTYTVIPGGGKESRINSETVPWGYEVLDIYVTSDGIDEISFTNQYDIGERKVENLELLPFSDIMAIYEKMMLIQNADVLTDKREEGKDVGEPLQVKNFYVNKITFGYTRIYDPQSDNSTGLFVPVWDFFGTYELSYDGENMISVNDVDKSFITINAVDGSIVDRWLGY